MYFQSLSGATGGYSSYSDHRSIESRSISSTGSQPNFDRPGNKYCAGRKNKTSLNRPLSARPSSARRFCPRDYFPNSLNSYSRAQPATEFNPYAVVKITKKSKTLPFLGKIKFWDLWINSNAIGKWLKAWVIKLCVVWTNVLFIWFVLIARCLTPRGPRWILEFSSVSNVPESTEIWERMLGIVLRKI